MTWIVEEAQRSDGLTFTTVYQGNKRISGIWKGQTEPPLQENIHIEIDIYLPIDELAPSESEKDTFSSALIDGTNVMSGQIEEIDDEDFMHFFRLSDDCLIMIESSEMKLIPGEFYEIHIPSSSLALSPS